MATPPPTATANTTLTAILGRHPTTPEADMWLLMDEGQREALTDLYRVRRADECTNQNHEAFTNAEVPCSCTIW